jgi:chromosome segregation ATPase
MSSITRTILRVGIIGGLALGGATLLIGPQRVAGTLAHVRMTAQDVVDNCMDDPSALRRQLAQLADEYPDKIAEVEGEIAKVDYQLAQFQSDIEMSQQVVALTTDDLQSLHALVSRAEAKAVTASYTPDIRFDGVRYDIEEAYIEGKRINSVRNSYSDRLGHDEFQLKFLQEQKGRLNEILSTLDGEFTTYQTQLWQLDRQIDAIERNEVLIKLTEEQQATLESYQRFGKAQNLNQIEAKLAQLRTVQEAQLRKLEKRGISGDYEDRARYEIDSQDINNHDPFEILELNGETENTDNSIAMIGPEVIE